MSNYISYRFKGFAQHLPQIRTESDRIEFSPCVQRAFNRHNTGVDLSYRSSRLAAADDNTSLTTIVFGQTSAMLNRLRAWNINAKFSYALIRQLAAKQYLAGAGRPRVFF